MDSETQVSFKDFEDKRILPYRDLNGRIATINLAIEKDVTGAQEMVHQKEINRLHNWLMDGDHRNIKDAESIIFGKNL